MMMIWLFSFKADMTMKARLVVNGKMPAGLVVQVGLAPAVSVYAVVASAVPFKVTVAAPPL